MSMDINFFSNDPNDKYFKCFRCGDCCKTSGIPITVYDIFRLARYFEKKNGEIIRKLCTLTYHPFPKDGIVLKEMLGVVFEFKEKPCIYLSNGLIPTCTIYEIRPIVCENTPNPINPLSIRHMYSSCPGLHTSQKFPMSFRDHYRQINSLHDRMMSLTARFFYDVFEWGQPLSDFSARFGETPDTILTPSGKKNTYEIIDSINRQILERIIKENAVREIIDGFNSNYETLIYNVKDIISKTATSIHLKSRFLNQIEK